MRQLCGILRILWHCLFGIGMKTDLFQSCGHCSVFHICWHSLIDRVPDELWTEVHDIVQETGIKTIPMETKWKKAKCLSEEALQIGVKRREVKSKEEKERYKHLNAEFQRIARRNKKTFLSNQCKEIEENNRMGKTRDLFRKIRDIKGRWAWKRTEMVWT